MLSRRFICLVFASLMLAGAARAADETFTPANPPEMKRMDLASSRAAKSATHFLRGANFGNYLEVPPGQNWSVKITAADFDHLKAEGFDHVRVPICWQNYTGPAPDFKLSDDIFRKVDFVLTNALPRGLAVMLNIHGFDQFTSDPNSQSNRFVAIWGQIASHYAALPNTVAFELLNEPKDAATTTVLNPIFAATVAEIRKTNPQRPIVWAPGRWNQWSELKNLVLPDDDNIIVSIHCYDPFYFTHQGATWAGADVKTKGIQFPGPPSKPLEPDPSPELKQYVRDWIKRYNTMPADKNPSGPIAFEGKLKYARDWSAYYGRPVHVGEFGCFTTADSESRAHFYASFRHAADEQKLGWCIWDWNAGFHYWDAQKNEPEPGMRAALFEKK